MKKYAFLLTAAAAVGFIFGACSHEAPFLGEWEGNPQQIAAYIDGSGAMNAVTTISFMEGTAKSEGKVDLAQDYTVQRTIEYKPGVPFTVNAKGKSTASGRWTTDVDDADDLLLVFDDAAVKAEIADLQITCPEALMNPETQAACDSISKVIRPQLTAEFESAFRRDMSRYAVISDIKVVKNTGMISFEIQQPEEDVTMRRVAP